MYKLYSILLAPSVRAMNGNRGRMVVQAGHGFLHALWDAEKRFPESAAAYKSQGSAFKIALIVDDPQVLTDLALKYGRIVGFSLVEETGSKVSGEVDESVVMTTALGLGPIHTDMIGDDLKLLRNFL
jgi:hypothetical protein